MAFTLTQVQFEEAQRIFNETGDPVALYDYLAGFDDRYAMLARTVVGETPMILGNVSKIYMFEAAQFYWDQAGINRTFTEEDYQAIAKDMAEAYLGLLENKLKYSNDQSNLELKWQEAYDLHKNVFESYGVDVRAWSMGIPMQNLSDQQNAKIWEEGLAISKSKSDESNNDSIILSTKILGMLSLEYAKIIIDLQVPTFKFVDYIKTGGESTKKKISQLHDISAWLYRSITSTDDLGHSMINQAVLKDYNLTGNDLKWLETITFAFSTFIDGRGTLFFGEDNVEQTSTVLKLLMKIEASNPISGKEALDAYELLFKAVPQEIMIEKLAKIYLGKEISINEDDITVFRDISTKISEVIGDNSTKMLIDLTKLSASEIVSQAKNSLAYAYALVNLNPFVIGGIDYSQFNQNGELTRFNPATGMGLLTDSYLIDRAHMLKALIAENTKGYSGSQSFVDLNVHDGKFSPVKGAPSRGGDYIYFGSKNADGNEKILGEKGKLGQIVTGLNHRIYGGDGEDQLITGAGEGKNHLEGGRGNDEYRLLFEGEHTAYDIGGDDTYTLGTKGTITIDDFKGKDTYTFTKGNEGVVVINDWGKDAAKDNYLVEGKGDFTIYDADGSGQVKLDGVKLIGGERDPDKDPEHTYFGDGKKYYWAGKDLTIDDGLVIKDFKNGDLGIDLITKEEEEPDDWDAANKTSPIIIDLNRDGITTSKEGNRIHFDLNANGFAESTGWINAQDGFLVADLNNNEKIDNGRELFGNNTLLNDGTAAANGFEALKEWDTNGDGLISALDEGWNQLKIWQDKNLNGRTDEGELLTLDQVGIKNIDLNYINQNVTDASGNSHLQIGKVEWQDGTSSEAVDVWFQVNPTNTHNLERVDISEEVLLLPNIQAFGNVADLHTAMQKNIVLRKKVEEFLASDFSAQKGLLEELIYEWTGSIDVDPYSRDPKKVYGHVMDARQLVALENLIGRGYVGIWCWGEKDPNPHGQAAPILIDEFYKFANYAHAALLAENNYLAEFKGLVLDQYNDQGQLFYDNTQFFQTLKTLIDKGDLDEAGTLVFIAQNIGNYDSLLRKRIENAFTEVANLGETYKNTIASLKNTLFGNASNNTLRGTDQDDILIGYAGNDTLNGGAGNDTYRFDKGFDRDQIYDSSGVDKITFGVGIALTDLAFSRNLTSLYITRVDQYKNPTNDRIEIRNFFDMDGSLGHGLIENIVFHDGSILNENDFFELVKPKGTEGDDALYLNVDDNEINALGGNDSIYAGSGDDVVYGGSGNDYIQGDHGNDQLWGEEGNDRLYGNDGDDLLIGGSGNDYLEGGRGNDTYIFGKNFGQDIIYNYDYTQNRQDVIQFTEGWKASDFTCRRSGYDLIITAKESTDRITINSYFYNDGAGAYRIDLITFEDGTKLTVDDIKALVLTGTEGVDELHAYATGTTLNGLGGNDKLYGKDGADVLIGGNGNDYLDGGNGSDTYIFGKNFGQDTINNYDNSKDRQDVIQFTEGWKASDFSYRRSGNNLIITTKESTDRITINRYFDYDGAGAYRIDLITFEDGTKLTVDDIKALVLIATEGADELHAYATGATLNGLGGNDKLYGKDGADVLIGGNGNDYLDGGNGSDTYIFGKNFGQDTINNYDNSKDRQDVIQFTEGWKASDFSYRRSGNNLIITTKESTDRITINRYFDYDGAGAYRIDLITFEDGTKLTVDDIKALVLTGTEGVDELHAYATGTTLNGLGGNDKLYGKDGADVLIGGNGNDYLDGGNGSDTYIFGKNFGQDTINNYDNSKDRQDVIQFTEGWKASDFSYRRSGNNLIITTKESTDRITINRYFDYDGAGAYRIDLITFEDGTKLTVDDIKALVLTGTEGVDELHAYATGTTLNGLGGNDKLYGKDGADVLIGGNGNDYLDGGNGSDTYIFGKNFGQDTINNYDNSKDRQDVIQFTEGWKASDFTYRRSYSNLIIAAKEGADQITVSNYFSKEGAGDYRIDLITFEDGTKLTVEAIKALVLTGAEGADELHAYATGSTLNGLGGE